MSNNFNRKTIFFNPSFQFFKVISRHSSIQVVHYFFLHYPERQKRIKEGERGRKKRRKRTREEKRRSKEKRKTKKFFISSSDSDSGSGSDSDSERVLIIFLFCVRNHQNENDVAYIFVFSFLFFFGFLRKWQKVRVVESGRSTLTMNQLIWKEVQLKLLLKRE